jgi:hypothetical protein
LKAQAQPELLKTQAEDASLINRREEEYNIETGAVIAPISRK